MTKRSEAGVSARDVDWAPLKRALEGEVIVSGDARMVLAKKQFAAGRPLPIPHALLRCRSTADVRRALAFLVERGLPFAVRSGGHCFADLSSSDSAVVDLSDLRHVAPRGERVFVGPGAHASRVSKALSAVGRAIPTGGCPLVAIGGISLVGGFGYLGRKHGLVADQVERLEMVGADGAVVHASREEAADLFWALRGAGAGNFGVVTELTLRTVPLASITICHGEWPLREAAALLELWQEFAPEADPDINLEVGLGMADDDETPPFVKLFGVLLGEEARAKASLALLERHLGALAPGVRTWRLPPLLAAEYLVGMLNHVAEPAWLPSFPYADTGFQFTRSDFFEKRLTREALRDCVERLGEDRRYAEAREVEFIPWGGAYAHDDGSACFQHRGARLLIRHTGMVGTRSTDALRAHVRQWVEASRAAVQPLANGRVYQGYADTGLGDWAGAYYGDRYARLQAVKRKYDPTGVFQHAQSIRPG
ncbi:FAD-binding oxidoreductase [Myxococcus sp. K15C18031901]|uniref:FAD-binding oxidoreductase n=1 Tax=Myxococcus dinghuensis TaxID=2906761 RepID=UPI0020A78B34|nr:FAD-binding oxidoreductase [Myxococcus dinghuensis]MCP3097393.1 FAD-binding oxidoreductase [Myxococcus dinghuensis]